MNHEGKIVEVEGTGAAGTSASGAAVVAKSVAWSIEQFDAAATECRAAEQRGDDLAGPLGVLLERLYTLVQRMPALKQSPEVCALRFARAQHVHQHASLTFRDAGNRTTWRPSSQLPRPADMQRWNDEDAAHYDRLLAGKPVTHALTAAE